tara:strand:- start:3856 stop:4629 length:774 start_codon:yes stop_codon:yes gene_type:complete
MLSLFFIIIFDADKFDTYIYFILILFFSCWVVYKHNKNKIKKEKLEKEQKNKTKKDKEDSEYIEGLFESVKDEKNHKAMFLLAKEYFEGNLVEKNYIDALYYVMKSERLGNPDAPKLKKTIETLSSDIQKKIASEKLSPKKIQSDINNINTEENEGGNVYIFTCSRWGGSIKVGKTNNLNRRLEEAQEEVKGTYSPRPPKVEIFFSQFSDKYSELETLVHSKLDAYRVEYSGKGREFFDIAPEEARRIIIEANRELE